MNKAHSHQFHDLTVAKVLPETDSAVVVSLVIPQTLRADYQFVAGQHLTLEMPINGERVRRSYSICGASMASDGPEQLQVGIKQIDGGVFSGYANSGLKAGDVLAVMPPQGLFTLPTDYQSTARHYLFIAAGSGITPILAMIDSVLSYPSNQVTLIYSNSNQKTILFLEQLAALKNQHPEQLALYHVLTQEQQAAELLSGRLDAEKLSALFARLINLSGIDLAYLCGPIGLVQCAQNFLQDQAFPAEQIKTELFNAGDFNASQNQKIKEIKALGVGEIDLTFTLNGQTKTVRARQDQNLLEAVIASGSDAPFACKGGVCATCKCLLEAGDSEMLVHYGLEDEHIKNGFILSCQSYAKSDKIKINFDC